jgi:UDP-glucose 4-epimerase
MKILVTGGAGFIGAHLVKRLIDLKHDVLSVDSMQTIGGIPYIHPKSKFIKGNILESQTLKKIKNWKPEIIYHIAAQSGGESAYDDPKNDYLSNGYGTYLLCVLAQEIKIKKFIYTSSVAVYGSNMQKKIYENTKINPDSIYGVSKYVGEMFIRQILKKTKIQTLIFRVFNTYGPGEDLNFLKKGMVSIYSSYLWRNKPILVKGSLNRFRNYQYIDDIINILVLSLKNKSLKKNEIINLSTAKAVTVKNLLKIIFKINNKKNHKIKETTGTPGDSFGYDASNKYLKSKYKYYKFISLEKGLKLYFKWIKKVPVVKDLRKYHPFKINK